MNSSTSSSERRGRWKTLLTVLLGLAAVLGALEVVTRLVLVPRSYDFVRFAHYPDRAAALCNQPGVRIAFVGNSATQAGVHPEQFVAALPSTSSQPIHVDLFLADASAINTWHYLVKNLFWRPGQNPDWLIVNFFDTCLQDGERVEIGRLARYFTTNDDWQELCDLELPDISQQAEYLLSRYWASFAVRDRLKKRVLNATVPDYKEFAEELNRSQFKQDRKREASAPVTHRALERFLAAAVKQRTKIIFVAFPNNRPDSSETYELHPDAQALIRKAGMYCVDLRRIPELTKEFYKDDIHLTKAGGEIYTRHLTQAVAPLIAANPAAIRVTATSERTAVPD